MRALLRTLFVASLITAFAAAQHKPNFTGTWKEAQSTPTSERSDEIDHRDPSLIIRTKSSSTAGPIGFALSNSRYYTTDGSERTSTGDESVAKWSAVRWQGSALVFLTVNKRQQSVTFTRETWTLSDDGRTLTKSRSVISPSGVIEKIVVLDKQ